MPKLLLPPKYPALTYVVFFWNIPWSLCSGLTRSNLSLSTTPPHPPPPARCPPPPPPEQCRPQNVPDSVCSAHGFRLNACSAEHWLVVLCCLYVCRPFCLLLLSNKPNTIWLSLGNYRTFASGFAQQGQLVNAGPHGFGIAVGINAWWEERTRETAAHIGRG